MPRGVVADSALCPLAAAPDPPFARGRFADSVQRAAEELADSNVRRLKQLRTRLDAGLEGLGGLRRDTWENSPLYHIRQRYIFGSSGVPILHHGAWSA